MPRKSKREDILRTAYAIVASDPGGIEAVTYDRLAADTELSKSGLLYHFPSRHALLVGLHEYTAALWEDKVCAHAGGKGADELTARERYRAMLVTMSEHEPLAELMVTLHSRTHPDYTRPWLEVEDRWLPRADDTAADPNLLAASALASGLWVHDHIYARPLAEVNRAVIVEKLLELIE